MKTALQTLEERLGIGPQEAEITIVYDYGKRKLRAKADNVWVRFPNNLRVEGAVYRATVKRGKADHYITIGDIHAVNELAKQAKRRAG